MNKGQQNWIVVISGLLLGFADTDSARACAENLCIRETILLMMRLCSLVRTPVSEELKLTGKDVKKTGEELETTSGDGKMTDSFTPDWIIVREIVFAR